MKKEVQNDIVIMQQQKELAQLIEAFTGEDGMHPTAIPALRLLRASQKSQPIYSVHTPVLCIVAQGRKLVVLAQESYYYDPSQYLVISVDLPISGQVLEASPQCPHLCMLLDFHPDQIFDILKEADPSWRKKGDSKRGLFVSNSNASLLDAALRLLRLLDTPSDIPILAPLIIREILYRILQGEQGDTVKQIAIVSSHVYYIAEVIRLIKQDFAKPLEIDKLALSVNMGISSLYQHFKTVTAMSPLQFQKQLRLHEARRLLLTGVADAANAGFQVGYESPSQFSREYARMFGLPPISDMKRLRDLG
ncbi:MAG TPA: AraC family transcriptional regulator [Methylomusa anaerophila]|uniref:Regulatory protein PchR n=1 Tax=Methylomusa anaerophila TaxID=1930071 RepID=A0A348AHU0_9FIRM|nr:AraC family transcriptional regulator [Methylomusa anaerophila]BBB90638.1 regulatory protein PchR [Methylomusa anaerophila]HML88754.1 AraC family transcriptional regulator [Methylomusa anaerophila]